MIPITTVDKALKLEKIDKARAWDYMIGYMYTHYEKCDDPTCKACAGLEGAVEFTREYPQ